MDSDKEVIGFYEFCYNRAKEDTLADIKGGLTFDGVDDLSSQILDETGRDGIGLTPKVAMMFSAFVAVSENIPIEDIHPNHKYAMLASAIARAAVYHALSIAFEKDQDLKEWLDFAMDHVHDDIGGFLDVPDNWASLLGKGQK